MARHGNLWLLAAASAGAAAAGAAAAGVLAQRRLKHRIEADPEAEMLRRPAPGAPFSLTSSDGTSLHAETFGPPEGQPIVLAHGWTETISYWTYVIRELSDRGFRVTAYDLRGHGASGRAVGGDYSLARFGDDLEAVLDTVDDRERAVVAGHSLGGMSIAAWAQDHQVDGRVGAVAMLNTGVGSLVAEQLLVPVPAVAAALNEVIAVRGFLGARAPLPRFSTPLSYALTRYAAFGPDASPAVIAFYERMLITCPPDIRADVGIAMSEMRLDDAIPRLTVPALVMAGENDRLTPPSHARRIAENLPRLHRLIILERTGHMGPLERPREVSAALTELAGVVRSGASAVAAGQGPT